MGLVYLDCFSLLKALYQVELSNNMCMHSYALIRNELIYNETFLIQSPMGHLIKVTLYVNSHLGLTLCNVLILTIIILYYSNTNHY